MHSSCGLQNLVHWVETGFGLGCVFVVDVGFYLFIYFGLGFFMSPVYRNLMQIELNKMQANDFEIVLQE